MRDAETGGGGKEGERGRGEGCDPFDSKEDGIATFGTTWLWPSDPEGNGAFQISLKLHVNVLRLTTHRKLRAVRGERGGRGARI